MKLKYEMPQVEVIEIQIEDAVLSNSDLDGTGSYSYTVDNFGTGSIFGN